MIEKPPIGVLGTIAHPTDITTTTKEDAPIVAIWIVSWVLDTSGTLRGHHRYEPILDKGPIIFLGMITAILTTTQQPGTPIVDQWVVSCRLEVSGRVRGRR
jgi:hypothetical protein